MDAVEWEVIAVNLTLVEKVFMGHPILSRCVVEGVRMQSP
jgi:hypothetical protein